MQRSSKPTRPSRATREKIVKAAARAFARQGYEGASIRAIVSQADVNQAAINYHFGSKEKLYLAVLQTASRALMKDDDAPSNPSTLSREAALRNFVRQQLRPMTARDNLSEYVRIFMWETLQPSPIFRKFMAEEAAPFFSIATDLVRRFLPSEATDKQALLGAL
jgi:AcrR family transcriptional regulator